MGLQGRGREVLIVGATRRRRDNESGDTPYDERVLGILHQELEKDDGCSPSRQTHNHQNVCFHFASGSVRNFLFAQEMVIKLIVDLIPRISPFNPLFGATWPPYLPRRTVQNGWRAGTLAKFAPPAGFDQSFLGAAYIHLPEVHHKPGRPFRLP